MEGPQREDAFLAPLCAKEVSTRKIAAGLPLVPAWPAPMFVRVASMPPSAEGCHSLAKIAFRVPTDSTPRDAWEHLRALV